MGKNRTMCSILKHYGETTTIKGIPKILKSTSIFLKLLWLTGFLLGATFGVYQLCTLLIKYFDYPVKTTIKETMEEPEFPDITLCNLNPSVNLTGNVNRETFMKGFFDFIIQRDDFGAFDRQLFTKEAVFTEINMTRQEFAEILKFIFSPSTYFQSFPTDPKRGRKYKEQFFEDCILYSWQWREHVMSCGDLIRVRYYPSYFLCFTLHLPDHLKEKIMGMSVMVYLDNSEKFIMPMFNPSAIESASEGVKLLIHPRDSLPSPKDGDLIAPGTDTTIRLSSERVEILPKPYGDCADKEYLEDEQEVIRLGTDNATRYVYDGDSCLNLCIQEKIIQTCNCIDPMYQYTDTLIHKYNYVKYRVPLCGNVSGISVQDGSHTINFIKENLYQFGERMACSLRVRGNPPDCSHCLSACSQQWYIKTLAQAPWPSKSYQLAFWEQYINSSRDGVKRARFQDYERVLHQHLVPDTNITLSASSAIESLQSLRTIEENFLKINILFDEPRVRHVIEEPVFTWDVMLATLGGALNLWIGITFLTLVELAELIFRLVFGDETHEKQKQKTNKIHVVENPN